MNRIYTLLLLLIPFIATAQTNYHPGYIIKANGDTIKGFIDYREWDNTPKVINFKTAFSDRSPDKYDPLTARGFEINGMEKYVSYSGTITMDKNAFPDLPAQLDTSTMNDHVFLKVVYNGAPVSLLEHKDKIKTRLFIKEVNKAPAELIYHQYYGDNTNLNTLEFYKQVLKQLNLVYNTADNKTVTAINYARFKESDITDIIKQINKDKNKNSGDKKSSGDSRFFAGVSYTYNITSFVGDIAFVGAKSNNNTPHVTVGMDIFTNKNTQKFFFRNALSFYAVTPKFNITSDLRYPPGLVPLNPADEYSFKQYTLTYTPQFVYNIYNKDNVKFFIDAGIPVNYSMYKDSYIIHTGKTYLDPYEFKKLWVNVQLQAGLTLNKTIDIFALYNTLSNINPAITFGMQTKSYGLGVNYLFK